MEKTVKERILEFIRFKNIPMKSFENQCNLSTGYVTSMRKGFGQQKLNNVLMAFPELNREWLLYGEGEMLQSIKLDEDNSVIGEMSDDVPAKFITYLVPLSAMGGSLTGFEEAGVCRDRCERIVSPIAYIDWVVPVSGDSMEPEYPNGSRVYVKEINHSDFIAWGHVYVLDTTNGIIIKVVEKSEEPDCVRCVSLNPSGRYAPFDVPFRTIRRMYKVVLCAALK